MDERERQIKKAEKKVREIRKKENEDYLIDLDDDEEHPLLEDVEDPLPSLQKMFEMDPFELDEAFLLSYFIHCLDKDWPTWRFRFQTVAKFKTGLHRLLSTFDPTYGFDFKNVEEVLGRVGYIEDYFEDKIETIEAAGIRTPKSFTAEEIKQMQED